MKKGLFIAGFFLIGFLGVAFGDVAPGYPIPKNVHVTTVTFRDGTVMTSTSPFSGGGGGSEIYPATATASFPYGLSGSTVMVNADVTPFNGGIFSLRPSAYYGTWLHGSGLDSICTDDNGYPLITCAGENSLLLNYNTHNSIAFGYGGDGGLLNGITRSWSFPYGFSASTGNFSTALDVNSDGANSRLLFNTQDNFLHVYTHEYIPPWSAGIRMGQDVYGQTSDLVQLVFGQSGNTPYTGQYNWGYFSQYVSTAPTLTPVERMKFSATASDKAKIDFNSGNKGFSLQESSITFSNGTSMDWTSTGLNFNGPVTGSSATFSNQVTVGTITVGPVIAVSTYTTRSAGWSTINGSVFQQTADYPGGVGQTEGDFMPNPITSTGSILTNSINIMPGPNQTVCPLNVFMPNRALLFSIGTNGTTSNYGHTHLWGLDVFGNLTVSGSLTSTGPIYGSSATFTGTITSTSPVNFASGTVNGEFYAGNITLPLNGILRGNSLYATTPGVGENAPNINISGTQGGTGETDGSYIILLPGARSGSPEVADNGQVVFVDPTTELGVYHNTYLLSADRTVYWPNASGTIALTDTSLPYTGAVNNVDVGTHSIKTNYLYTSGTSTFYGNNFQVYSSSIVITKNVYAGTMYPNIINAETYTKAGYYASYDGTNVVFRLASDAYGFQFKNTAGVVVATVSATGGVSGSTASFSGTVTASSNVSVGNIIYTNQSARVLPASTDFLSSQVGMYPWLGAAFGTTGALSNGSGTTNHIGVIGLRNGLGANSGWRYMTDGTAFLISGGETTDFVFQTDLSTAGLAYLGWHDTTTQVAPTDAVMIKISSINLVGMTYNNGVSSQTVSTYTCVGATTWYHAKIVVNSSATLVTFSLFNEVGATLWTDTLTDNIPTGAGRTVGHGVVSCNTAGGAVTFPLTMDFMSFYVDRNLYR